MRGSSSFIHRKYSFHWRPVLNSRPHMLDQRPISLLITKVNSTAYTWRMSDQLTATTFDLEPVLPHLQDLLSMRAHPKTLCPSEAARALSKAELKDAGVETWRDLMPAIRSLCFRMRDEGGLEILQRGQVLPDSQSMEDTRGPLRIRKGLK